MVDVDIAPLHRFELQKQCTTGSDVSVQSASLLDGRLLQPRLGNGPAEEEFE